MPLICYQSVHTQTQHATEVGHLSLGRWTEQLMFYKQNVSGHTAWSGRKEDKSQPVYGGEGIVLEGTLCQVM